jgi:hypothetical protein
VTTATTATVAAMVTATVMVVVVVVTAHTVVKIKESRGDFSGDLVVGDVEGGRAEDIVDSLTHTLVFCRGVLSQGRRAGDAGDIRSEVVLNVSSAVCLGVDLLAKRQGARVCGGSIGLRLEVSRVCTVGLETV